jgi:hypothetical protein
VVLGVVAEMLLAGQVRLVKETPVEQEYLQPAFRLAVAAVLVLLAVQQLLAFQ